jgi:acetyl-CoA C-acetyltransferase
VPAAVVVESTRVPIGKRSGVDSGRHAVKLLGATRREMLSSAGLDAQAVELVISGCGAQAGELGAKVIRRA